MGNVRYPEDARSWPVDLRLEESDSFFGGRGVVHTTLRTLADRLRQETNPFAIVGGMALNIHGYRRETVDVDILMTRAGLARFRERFVGRGYAPAFSGAQKTFRDAETGVKVDVLTTGEFPGDGKPKPVVFPDPVDVSVNLEGYPVITLEKLIDLKLASGLSAPHRMGDLVDVQRLVEELHLPPDLDAKLDPSVRAEYRRLWELAQVAGEGPQERG